MAARAEPGAPFPPSLPLRLRILGYSNLTSSGTSPAPHKYLVPTGALSVLMWSRQHISFDKASQQMSTH